MSDMNKILTIFLLAALFFLCLISFVIMLGTGNIVCILATIAFGFLFVSTVYGRLTE